MSWRKTAVATAAAWAILGTVPLLSAQSAAQPPVAVQAPVAAQDTAGASAQVPRTLAMYAQEELSRLARTPSIVAYIEAQNARRVRIADLKVLDARWAAARGVEDYMWSLMRNPLSWVLADFQYQHKFIVEAFAMDSRGAIVAETNRTSSYYKGEAEKFTAAYAGGTGALWYGPAAFDESTAEMVIQVSVPVMKGSRAIGVICFSVSLDRWEDRRLGQ
jgi:hypothetical protein